CPHIVEEKKKGRKGRVKRRLDGPSTRTTEEIRRDNRRINIVDLPELQKAYVLYLVPAYFDNYFGPNPNSEDPFNLFSARYITYSGVVPQWVIDLIRNLPTQKIYDRSLKLK